MSEELWRRGAGELAQLIASREVSSREVVDAHLERIEAVNGHLNAIVVTLADEARAAADAADAADGRRGPLHGVPFTVKENIDVAGTATTSGVPAAALATGMSPLGLGNDVGGSLRNPAHCCGIASIKPTPGRVPHATVIPPR
jgi:amidase